MICARPPCGVTLALCFSLCIGSAGGCSEASKTAHDATDAANDNTGQGGTSGSAGYAGSEGGSSGSAGSEGGSAGDTSGSGGAGSNPLNCLSLGGDPLCIRCARQNCCFELLTCSRDPLCARGGDGEFWCVLSCMTGAVSDGGIADDATFAQCASACAKVATIAPTTNEMIACLLDGKRADGAAGTDCAVECFGGA